MTVVVGRHCYGQSLNPMMELLGYCLAKVPTQTLRIRITRHHYCGAQRMVMRPSPISFSTESPMQSRKTEVMNGRRYLGRLTTDTRRSSSYSLRWGWDGILQIAANARHCPL